MLRPKDPYGPQMREYGVKHSHKIPTLQMDGEEICESGVISQVVVERRGSGQGLMGTAKERIQLLQWVAMAETCITFRIPLMPTLMAKDTTCDDLRNGAIEPMRRVFEANIERFEKHFEAQGSDYLLESGFSIADTMCGWSLFTFHGWGIMDLSSGTSPLTLAYLERLKARPALKTRRNTRAQALAYMAAGVFH